MQEQEEVRPDMAAEENEQVATPGDSEAPANETPAEAADEQPDRVSPDEVDPGTPGGAVVDSPGEGGAQQGIVDSPEAAARGDVREEDLEDDAHVTRDEPDHQPESPAGGQGDPSAPGGGEG